MVARIKTVKKSPVSKNPKSKPSSSPVKSKPSSSPVKSKPSSGPVKSKPSPGLSSSQKAAIATALSLGVLGLVGYAGRKQLKKNFLSKEEKDLSNFKDLESKRVFERQKRLGINALEKKIRIQQLEDESDKIADEYEFEQLAKQKRSDIKKNNERIIKENRMNNLQSIRDSKAKKDDYAALIFEKNIIEGNSWKNWFSSKPKALSIDVPDKARKVLGI